MTTPIEVFFSYAHGEDENLMELVRRQLVVFERQGQIRKRHDRQIPPGTEWKGHIDERLRSCRIILLMVSPDFLASDYCYENEMTEALRRHNLGEARVVPIILRPCRWDVTPLGKLQALPLDLRPISKWDNRDDASLNVANGVMQVVSELQLGSNSSSANQSPSAFGNLDGEHFRLLHLFVERGVSRLDLAKICSVLGIGDQRALHLLDVLGQMRHVAFSDTWSEGKTWSLTATGRQFLAERGLL